jgi:hypothetical protein
MENEISMPWLRRVRNNTPCLLVCGVPSGEPPSEANRRACRRSACSLSVPPFLSFRVLFVCPPPHVLLGRHVEFNPAVSRSVSPQFVTSTPRRRASPLLLHEALDHGLEIEVGRCQVGGNCGMLANTLPVGGRWGKTHPPCPQSRWVPPWTWRRPPWPGLLTSACARTRAASRPPSATR